MTKYALSVSEACSVIGCGRTKLFQLIGSKQLEALRLGRKLLIPSDEVNRFLSQLPKARPSKSIANR